MNLFYLNKEDEKMKKKISLFLAIVMLFSLVGCKKEQSDNSKEHIEV